VVSPGCRFAARHRWPALFTTAGSERPTYQQPVFSAFHKHRGAACAFAGDVVVLLDTLVCRPKE
jgi:hypothetical protein